MTCLFSPRATKDMLTWYADRIRGAESAVMFTGAFGVSEILAPAFAEDRDFLRFILLEKPPSKKTRELLGPGPGPHHRLRQRAGRSLYREQEGRTHPTP